MPRTVTLPADNQNHPLPNGQALEMFEHERNEMFQITNYLEALYARLLTETTGAATLTVIADERGPAESKPATLTR